MATPLPSTDAGVPESSGTVDFEQSMSALETIVEQLEQGKLSLDEALAHFERGVQLSRACQAALAVAEQRVEILLGKSPVAPLADESSSIVPFAPESPRDGTE